MGDIFYLVLDPVRPDHQPRLDGKACCGRTGRHRGTKLTSC